MLLPKLIDSQNQLTITTYRQKSAHVSSMCSLLSTLWPPDTGLPRDRSRVSHRVRESKFREDSTTARFNLYSVKSVKPSDAGRPGGDEHHKKSLHQLWRWFQRKLSWHFSWHWSCWPPLWAATQPTRTALPLLQHLVNTASLSTRDVGFSASRCLWNTSQNWHKQHLKEVTIITFTRVTIVTFTRVTIVTFDSYKILLAGSRPRVWRSRWPLWHLWGGTILLRL